MNTTIKIIGAVVVFGLLGYFVGAMIAPDQDEDMVEVNVEIETMDDMESNADLATGTIPADSDQEIPTVDDNGNELIGGDAVATPTQNGVFEATILAGGFYYDIEEIRVKQGDTVRLTLRSVEGAHNFALDEFGIESPVVSGDQETVIEFVADQVGTFEYYCSVGSHRELGQVGTLIVE